MTQDGGPTDPAPGTGAPTLHLAIVGSVVLLASVAAFFRVPVLPALGSDLGMNAAQLGLITTVFALGRIVTDVPAGRMTERVRTTTLLTVSGLILATGSLLLSGARTPTAALAASFVLGVASSITNTTGMTFFSTARPAAQRGRTLALYSASLLVGQAFGPTAGGLLAGPLGWRGALVGAAILAGVLVLGVRVAALVVRPRVGTLRAVGTVALTDGAAATPPPPQPGTGREVRILLLVPFTLFFVLGSLPQTLIPIIGDARYGLPPSSIGLALGLGGVCRLIGTLVGGRIADHIGRRAALLPGMLLTLGGIVVLAVGGPPWAWIAAIVLISLGSSGLGSAATMLTDLTPAGSIGRRMGVFRMIGDLGLVAGPVVATSVYVAAGQAASVATVAALLTVSTLLTALLVRETRHRAT